MTKRVGLLTLPLLTNYGGILQAAALYQYLTALGMEVVFLERALRKSRAHGVGLALVGLVPSALLSSRSVKEGDAEDRSLHTRLKRLRRVKDHLPKIRAQRPFIHRFIPRRSGPLYSSQEMRHAVSEFGLEAVIVGSDQVWRPDYLLEGALSDYFLGFAEGTPARRVSYAASFGHGAWRFPDRTAEVSRLLSGFSAVSVREASGVEICRDVFGRGDAVQVLDPTLIVDPAFYDRLADAPTVKSGKVLVEYILDFDLGNPTIGNEVAASLWDDTYSVRSLILDSERSPLGIGGWVRAFMDADFIMTDSFHGMVFSILFKKNFIVIVNHKRGADRFTSLAGLFGLEDRLIDGTSRSQALEIAARPIDYDSVSARLDTLRERSRAFLRKALEDG